MLLGPGVHALRPRRAVAQSDVPPERQVLILTRALAYDEALQSRVRGGEITIGILGKPGNAGSDAMALAMANAFRGVERLRIKGRGLKVIVLSYTTAAAFEAAIESQGIVVAYVCVGLDNELAGIAQLTRRRRVTSIGSRREHVTRGLSMGVFMVDERPTIVVNLTASREEGAVLSSDLLRLATVIR